MGAHLIGGEFQSDKYPTTPRGKVPLSTKDKHVQDLLWEVAQRYRAIDAELSDDLETALRLAGYTPSLRPGGDDTPWPTRDILRVLAEAADHYLAAHDCDHEGYENVVAAVRAVRAAPSSQAGGEPRVYREALVKLSKYEETERLRVVHVNEIYLALTAADAAAAALPPCPGMQRARFTAMEMATGFTEGGHCPGCPTCRDRGVECSPK